MAVNVCPIASVNAPVETVWRLLSNPSAYALWWDAETRSIVPAGPAQPGQEIHAQTRGPGKAWDVHIVVNRVGQRSVRLTYRRACRLASRC